MTQKTYAMIKPGFEEVWSKVLIRITQEGFAINKVKPMKWNEALVDEFYAEHIGKAFFPSLKEYILSGWVLALELEGIDAIANWRRVIGPTRIEVAKAEAPDSLRAMYARSTQQNLAHGSDGTASAARELALVFGA